MTFASVVRRRLIVVVLAGALSLGLLALAARPASAEPRVGTGGETRLFVQVNFFLALVNDGIFATAIEPAFIQFGFNPQVVFPMRPNGAMDAANSLSLTTHDGGLRLEKESIGMTVDTTNFTVQCTSLTGCRLLGTANQALPNEVAEIVDVTITDDEAGTVTLQGRAVIGEVTALALNTLFQTNIFVAGMEMGPIVSKMFYDPTEPGGYVRPRGATPVRVSLVPAYDACLVPNREHGPPLAEPSCNPPAQSSTTLTVGTADANGAPANSVASARYSVISGNPANQVEDADVGIDVDATDVRVKSDLSDYTGELQALVDVRVTDRNNSVAPPIFPDNQTGTVQDTSLSATVPCAATASTSVGSECSLSTTADALVPGIVTERDRAIWQLGQIRLMDGGLDGDADTAPDNTAFARQGIFVP